MQFGSVDLTEPGKRQWEPSKSSKSGCLNWSVDRLHLRARQAWINVFQRVEACEFQCVRIVIGSDLVFVAVGKLLDA